MRRSRGNFVPQDGEEDVAFNSDFSMETCGDSWLFGHSTGGVWHTDDTDECVKLAQHAMGGQPEEWLWERTEPGKGFKTEDDAELTQTA